MRLPLLFAAALLVAGCVTPPGDAPPPAGALVAGYSLVCEGLATGPGWTEPCVAFASPNDSPAKTEIDLAVDPTDQLRVVVSSKDLDPLASRCVWAVPQVSDDGGASWTTVYIGGKADERSPTDPLFGWHCITDPIMAFDADGTLFYSLQAYDHTVEAADLPELPLPTGSPVGAVGSAIFATRSQDGGLTWDKTVLLHAGEGTAVFHDYMRVLVNPATGTYHTIWNQFDGFVVVPVLVSWDGASDRAAAPVYVPVPDVPGGATMSGFTVTSEGTMYALMDAGPDGFLTMSTDDGRTWSSPVKVDAFTRTPIQRQALGDDAFRTTGSYELVADTSGGARHGWLYATISEQVREDADLYVSRSEDGGATWSDRVLLNGGEHQPGFQWMGRPFVDRLGNLHVVYLDSSRNAGDDTMLDASWAVSTDGGATFSNAYLTSQSFDGNLGIHQDGFPFIGDYLGIGGAGDFVHMGFPTTVTGRAEIGLAKVRLPGAAG